MSRDTGYKKLKRACEEYFSQWGIYMKRAQTAERKVEKLKALMLLTDPAFSSTEVSDLTIRQWTEFIKEFPDEGSAT